MLMGRWQCCRQGNAGSTDVQLTFLCRYRGPNGFNSATSCDQCSATHNCLKPFMFSEKALFGVVSLQWSLLVKGIHLPISLINPMLQEAKQESLF